MQDEGGRTVISFRQCERSICRNARIGAAFRTGMSAEMASLTIPLSAIFLRGWQERRQERQRRARMQKTSGQRATVAPRLRACRSAASR